MEHTGLVADKLFEVGFNTSRVVGFPVVEVWLDSRKVSKSEVETALNQHFEGYSFKVTNKALQTVKSNPNGVEVIVE